MTSDYTQSAIVRLLSSFSLYQIFLCLFSLFKVYANDCGANKVIPHWFSYLLNVLPPGSQFAVAVSVWFNLKDLGVLLQLGLDSLDLFNPFKAGAIKQSFEHEALSCNSKDPHSLYGD